MRIKITDEEYKTIRSALRICDAGEGPFAADCFFLGMKLEKAKRYSESNKQVRGVLRSKSIEWKV